MAARQKGVRKQVIIRLGESDLGLLRETQKKLGDLSQSDTVKILLRLYLKKLSAFPTSIGG